MRKVTKTLALVFAVTTFMFFMAPAASQAKVKVLKFGHVNAPASHFHYACLQFKEVLEKKSNGTLRVEVYPSEQLGTGQEHIQGLVLGTIACNPEIDVLLGNVAPMYNVWGVFYLFDSIENVKKFKAGPLQEKMNQQAISKGIRQIGYYDCNNIFNMLSKKPVRNLADLQGLKNRTIPVESLIAGWKALGSSPVGLSFSEVYTSLSTNLVQAIDNPIADMYHENFHEVTDYLCMTKDLVNVVSWNFSERVWQSLSAQEQKWVTETAVEIQPAIKAWSDKDDAAALEAFKKEGIEIIQTDLTGFADRIAANIDTVLGGKEELIQLYKDIRAAQK